MNIEKLAKQGVTGGAAAYIINRERGTIGPNYNMSGVDMEQVRKYDAKGIVGSDFADKAKGFMLKPLSGSSQYQSYADRNRAETLNSIAKLAKQGVTGGAAAYIINRERGTIGPNYNMSGVDMEQVRKYDAKGIVGSDFADKAKGFMLKPLLDTSKANTTGIDLLKKYKNRNIEGAKSKQPKEVSILKYARKELEVIPINASPAEVARINSSNAAIIAYNKQIPSYKISPKISGKEGVENLKISQQLDLAIDQSKGQPFHNKPIVVEPNVIIEGDSVQLKNGGKIPKSNWDAMDNTTKVKLNDLGVDGYNKWVQDYQGKFETAQAELEWIKNKNGSYDLSKISKTLATPQVKASVSLLFPDYDIKQLGKTVIYAPSIEMAKPTWLMDVSPQQEFISPKEIEGKKVTGIKPESFPTIYLSGQSWDSKYDKDKYYVKVPLTMEQYRDSVSELRNQGKSQAEIDKILSKTYLTVPATLYAKMSPEYIAKHDVQPRFTYIQTIMPNHFQNPAEAKGWDKFLGTMNIATQVLGVESMIVPIFPVASAGMAGSIAGEASIAGSSALNWKDMSTASKGVNIVLGSLMAIPILSAGSRAVINALSKDAKLAGTLNQFKAESMAIDKKIKFSLRNYAGEDIANAWQKASKAAGEYYTNIQKVDEASKNIGSLAGTDRKVLQEILNTKPAKMPTSNEALEALRSSGLDLTADLKSNSRVYLKESAKTEELRRALREAGTEYETIGKASGKMAGESGTLEEVYSHDLVKDIDNVYKSVKEATLGDTAKIAELDKKIAQAEAKLASAKIEDPSATFSGGDIADEIAKLRTQKEVILKGKLGPSQFREIQILRRKASVSFGPRKVRLINEATKLERELSNTIKGTTELEYWNPEGGESIKSLSKADIIAISKAWQTEYEGSKSLIQALDSRINKLQDGIKSANKWDKPIMRNNINTLIKYRAEVIKGIDTYDNTKLSEVFNSLYEEAKTKGDVGINKFKRIVENIVSRLEPENPELSNILKELDDKITKSINEGTTLSDDDISALFKKSNVETLGKTIKTGGVEDIASKQDIITINNVLKDSSAYQEVGDIWGDSLRAAEAKLSEINPDINPYGYTSASQIDIPVWQSQVPDYVKPGYEAEYESLLRKAQKELREYAEKMYYTPKQAEKAIQEVGHPLFERSDELMKQLEEDIRVFQKENPEIGEEYLKNFIPKPETKTDWDSLIDDILGDTDTSDAVDRELRRGIIKEEPIKGGEGGRGGSKTAVKEKEAPSISKTKVDWDEKLKEAQIKQDTDKLIEEAKTKGKQDELRESIIERLTKQKKQPELAYDLSFLTSFELMEEWLRVNKTQSLSQSQTATQPSVKTVPQIQVQPETKTQTKSQTKAQTQTQTKIQEQVKEEVKPQEKVITKTQLQEQTRTQMTRIEPQPRILLPIITKSGRELTQAEKDASVQWKQGVMYKMIYPPYEQDDIINQKVPFPGMKIHTGPKSAFYTLARTQKGKLPPTISRDMGMMSIQIIGGDKTDSQPVIQFVEREERKGRGRVRPALGRAK